MITITITNTKYIGYIAVYCSAVLDMRVHKTILSNIFYPSGLLPSNLNIQVADIMVVMGGGRVQKEICQGYFIHIILYNIARMC
jgi:hypothetical protein